MSDRDIFGPRPGGAFYEPDPVHTEDHYNGDDIPTLTRSQCREQALAFRDTLTDANLDQDTIYPNDIPAIQLALTASLLYAVMALDQDRPA